MSQDGLLSIDLLPPWQPSSVLARIQQSLKTSQNLKASVAYCTVAGSEVSDLLPSRLSAPNGFLCVDLHLPTDVDRLAKLVQDGAAVYLYLEKIKGLPGVR